ncbi:MAG: NAD(P)H-hydrate dehydratase [Bacteroidales bacterium]
MKFFPTARIKEIDQYTIDHEPVLSINLMERAAKACTRWIINNLPPETEFLIFCGPGNNGGDGLAIARQLADEDFSVKVAILRFTEKVSDDFAMNLKRLDKYNQVDIFEIKNKADFPEIKRDNVLIDGIFGSGLTRPAEGLPGEIISLINQTGNTVVAIDIPSGLFGEDNSRNPYETVIKATYTLSFQFPKQAFFYRENAPYTGDWHVLPIGLHPKAIEEIHSDLYHVTPGFVKSMLKQRDKYSHKGNYGHALLIAGSYGMMGAAVLATKACLRTGVGLVTTHVPRKGCDIIQVAVPEALVSIDESEIVFAKLPDLSKYTAIGIGPALTKKNNCRDAFKHLIGKTEVPLVIDADGLNILSENNDWLADLPPNAILTPHPKEFERLAGEYNNAYQRNQAQIEFSKKYNVIVVLKGANTSISLPDGRCFYNTTGNPGMATGGSGDVLTGMILSLLAQGYQTWQAAILATYLHGMAGDFAAAEKGEEAMIPGDIIDFIGNAFKSLKCS